MIRMLHKMDNVKEEEDAENPLHKATTLSAASSESPLATSTDTFIKPQAEDKEDEDDAEWDKKVKYLLLAFFAAAAIDIFEYFFPIVAAIPLFTYFHLPVVTSYYWTLTPSLSYVGQGMIMGPKTGFSMLLGAIVGWGILAPVAKSKGMLPNLDILKLIPFPSKIGQFAFSYCVRRLGTRANKQLGKWRQGMVFDLHENTLCYGITVI
jgi:uncharacterized oligopeptide transporter (OPT) family protein